LVKQILFLALFSACAHQSKTSFKDSKYIYLSPEERKRARYYKDLRRKKSTKRKIKNEPKLSAEDSIILTQHIQMKCFEKRIKQKRCQKLLSKKPAPCIKLIKKRRISKVSKCLDKTLFYK